MIDRFVISDSNTIDGNFDLAALRTSLNIPAHKEVMHTTYLSESGDLARMAGGNISIGTKLRGGMSLQHAGEMIASVARVYNPRIADTLQARFQDNLLAYHQQEDQNGENGSGDRGQIHEVQQTVADFPREPGFPQGHLV